METLDIGVLSDVVYPYTHGGAEKRYALVSRELVRRGHEVTVHTMRWWDGPDMERHGVRYRAIAPARPLYANASRRSFLQPATFALGALPGLQGTSHDVVDCNQFPYLHVPPAQLQAMARGTTLLVTWHEVWGRYWQRYAPFPGGLAGAWVERAVRRLAHGHVAVSHHTARGLLAAGASKDRLEVVPDPVDLPRIDAVVPAEETVDVVFAGRLVTHKRVDQLLGAVAVLRRRGVHVRCVIVGSGPEERRLRSLAVGLGVADLVRFTGPLPEDEMLAWVKASRVFASPSVREGFGMAALEAMACGLPVVTVRHPMNALAEELVRPGSNGLVVESRGCRAFADGLEEVLRDDAATRRMGAAARRTAEAYDAPVVARHLEATYATMIARRTETTMAARLAPFAARVRGSA